jgi:serine/threonine-protein kinase RsbW
MGIFQNEKIKQIYKGFILNDAHCACENIMSILNRIQNYVSLNSDQYFDVRIILSELLQNAIKHGNESERNKKIYMSVHLEGNNILKITVRDQGGGFNGYKTLNEKMCRKICDVQNLMECGRGLQIVKSLCDQMNFNRRGNCITVLKKLG